MIFELHGAIQSGWRELLILAGMIEVHTNNSDNQVSFQPLPLSGTSPWQIHILHQMLFVFLRLVPQLNKLRKETKLHLSLMKKALFHVSQQITSRASC